MNKEIKNEEKKVDKNISKEQENKEMSLEELEDVNGGSIRNVHFTPTYDITEDIKRRI